MTKRNDEFVKYNINRIAEKVESNIITFGHKSRRLCYKKVKREYLSSFLSSESKEVVAKILKIRTKILYLFYFFVFNLLMMILFILLSINLLPNFIPIIFGVIALITLIPMPGIQINNSNWRINHKILFSEIDQFLTNREKTIFIFRRKEVKANYWISMEKVKYKDLICILAISFERSLGREENISWKAITEKSILVEKEEIISKSQNFFKVIIILSGIFLLLLTSAILLLLINNSFVLEVLSYILFGFSFIIFTLIAKAFAKDIVNSKKIKKLYIESALMSLEKVVPSEMKNLLSHYRDNNSLTFLSRRKIILLILYSKFLSNEIEFAKEPKISFSLLQYDVSDMVSTDSKDKLDWFKK